ncbi:MAG: hypothetical protein J1E05_05250 [Eubacterium sp.]|nr:hypothetical protein [Eubacterium sp.]
METLRVIISMVGGFFLTAIALFLLGGNFWLETFGWVFVLLYIFLSLVCSIIIDIWLSTKF